VIVANPLLVVKEVFGEKLAGLLVFGSHAREGDAAPGSDLNIAIVLREEATVYERAGIYSSMVGPVSPVILTLEQLGELWERGDFLAHELHGDSAPLYVDDELAGILERRPPITDVTLGYLRRHSLAALGVAAEEHVSSRWVDSINYSYRAYRSAVRYLEAAEHRIIPFSDAEILRALSARGVRGGIFRRLRALRRLGGGRMESREALERAFGGVKSLLGLGGVDAATLLEEAEGKRVSRIRVYEGDGRALAEIRYVGPSGKMRKIILG